MSLERTALRLAAVMALTNGFAAPYPTMAGKRVYDSRMDPLEDYSAAPDFIPQAVINVDADDGKSLSTNNGGPPFEHSVTLCVDLSIGIIGRAQDEEGNEVDAVMLPQTEPELEAALDLFERQVSDVFRYFPGTWGARLYPICRRVADWNSSRYVQQDTAVRLAVRQIKATVLLPLEADANPVAEAASPTIPEPLGPLLAAIIAADGPFAPAAQTLTDMLTANGGAGTLVIPTLTTPTHVRLIEADQAEKNNAGTPKGARSDGVADVEMEVP